MDPIGQNLQVTKLLSYLLLTNQIAGKWHICTILPVQDVDTIFGDIAELHELSVQLVGSLEDCIEMAGEMQGARCPQAGFVFEELAEVTTYVQLVCVHVRTSMCVYGCMYCALKFGLEELAELGCVSVYVCSVYTCTCIFS